MRQALALPLLACLATSAFPAKTPSTIQVKPVCGNADNGIVVGKPRLSDERTIALMLDSLESRLQHLRAGRPRPYRVPESLAEETQLTQQISNFRALAERALTDRVSMEPKGLSTVPVARVQTLLSFQVSIDAQRFRNAVAEVEVAVSTRDSRLPPTLVTLLPKDKTYNFATIYTGANVGDAMIEKGSSPDGQEQFTVAKDYDTVALERQGAAHEAIRGCGTGFHESVRDLVFEWQFRPVLGRESVDPGMREVFAFLTLPTAAGEEYDADVHVHTHWRAIRQNKANGTLGYIEESARDELWTSAIRFNPGAMEQRLRPTVRSARFVSGGKDDYVIIADGQNFLPDTAVMVGRQNFSGQDLTIARERQLQFRVAGKLLVENDIYLAGRFGAPTLLAEPRVFSEDRLVDPAWGLRIESARARPRDGENSELRIKLKSRQRKKPMEEWIVNNTLVSVAGRVSAVTNVEREPADTDAIVIRLDMPTAVLRESARVVVARVFGGELFRDTAAVVLEDDIKVTEVTVLAVSDDDLTLGIAGSGFSSHAEVQLAGQNFTQSTNPALGIQGTTLLTLQTTRDLLASAKQLIVRQGAGKALLVAAPEIENEGSSGRSRKH